jgi:hypothetical protein
VTEPHFVEMPATDDEIVARQSALQAEAAALVRGSAQASDRWPCLGCGAV